MPVNPVTDRSDPSSSCVDDESLALSVCPNGDPPSTSTVPSTPTASNASSDVVQNLVAKFPTSPTTTADTTGCGTVQDCPGADGRPILEGQNSSGPDAEFSLTARRFAPFGTFGFGFEGDAQSRGITGWLHDGFGGFSTSPSATSRTSLTISVDGAAVTPEAHADPSHHFLLGAGLADVTVAESAVTASSSDGTIRASSAGANPLVPFAPDIDTNLQVTYDSNGHSLALEGSLSGDLFPNAEVFVSDSAGQREMLGEYQTGLQEIQGPLSLALTPLIEPKLTRFRAEIPLDPSGNFAGTPAVNTK